VQEKWRSAADEVTRVAACHKEESRIIIIIIIIVISKSNMEESTAEAKLKSGNNCR
jgi:hypothetical protein